MTASTGHHDAIVLIHRRSLDWQVEGCRSPLFVCAEMFLELRDVESRRWQMWSLRASLVDAGLPVAALCDFLLSEDIAWLESQSVRVARAWYLDSAGDETIYRDISLGRCVEYEVKARTVRLLKLSRCVQRLLLRHPDAKVYSDFAEHSTEQRLLKQLQVAAHPFGEPEIDNVGPPARAAAPKSVRSLVLAKGRRWGLAAMKLLAWAFAGRQRSDAPLVLVRLGLQSLNMLQSWARTPQRPRVRFALWMEHLVSPRSVPSLVVAGAAVTGWPLRVSAPGSPQSDRISELLLSLFSRSRPSFHVESGLHLEPLLNDMLRDISNRSFCAALAAIDYGYEIFEHSNAALFVTLNDCLPLERAWTLVATRLGKASLVLQHGHLDYTEDGNHLTATHSAFWSGMVAHEFQDAALRPEQIFVTGSPNADAYITLQRQPRKAGSGRTQAKPRVLIITTGNPGVQAYIDETWVCDYIVGVLDALSSRIRDFSIAVKLHPGEARGLYQRYLGTRLPRGTDISDRGDLARMVLWADVVISPPSTVVLEARAGGAAVIMVPVPSVNDRMTTLVHAEGVVSVSAYDELPSAIDDIVAGRPHARVGTWPLSTFFGPLDGNSSRRLLDAVATVARVSQDSEQSRPEPCR